MLVHFPTTSEQADRIYERPRAPSSVPARRAALLTFSTVPWEPTDRLDFSLPFEFRELSRQGPRPIYRSCGPLVNQNK